MEGQVDNPSLQREKVRHARGSKDAFRMGAAGRVRRITFQVAVVLNSLILVGGFNVVFLMIVVSWLPDAICVDDVTSRQTMAAPWQKGASGFSLWLPASVLWAFSLPYLAPVRSFLSGGPPPSLLEPTVDDFLSFLMLLGLTTIGLIIILRGTRRRFSWLMLVAGFSLSLDSFAQLHAAYVLLKVPEMQLPLGNLAAWMQNLRVIKLSLLFIYMPLLFPDGELPSRRW